MFTNPRISTLIRQSIKAATVRHAGTTANARRQGAAMLQAFGIVAADVLGIVMAPAGWETAAIETLNTVGLPPRYTPTSGAAERKALEEWHAQTEAEMRRRVEMVGGTL